MRASRWPMLSALALTLAFAVGLALAQGAKQSSPIDTPPDQLKPGQFIWSPETVPAGPLVMVISLDEQRAYLYRNGLRIGVSTVSSGKRGKETPTGVFTILQKHKEHRSNLYDDAPMPYMQRLTWDGVALHAGNLPGYPASHGCIRLPYEFARRLFELTSTGMTVVIASAAQHNAELAHPGLFSPGAPVGGNAPEQPRLSWFQAFRWTPERSPEGPLTVLLSVADRRVLAIRNGIEIGRAAIAVSGEGPLGTHAYVLLAGDSGQPSPVVSGRPGRLWQSIPLPGYAAEPGTRIDPAIVNRITISPHFATLVYDALQPGSTVLITDAAILPATTGESMTVISTEDAAETPPPSEHEPP